MNYLAHFYLAFGNDDLLIGQFAADAVKGKAILNYSEGVQKGILLHRYIDQQTDEHPACRELRAVLRPHLGLLSSITIDMYLDYVLANQWAHYYPESLQSFAQRCYLVFGERREELPERMQYILKYMSEQDWLSRYSTVEGVGQSLLGLSKRVSGGQALVTAAERMPEWVDEAEKAFNIYFPELIDNCKVKLNTFGAPEI